MDVAAVKAYCSRLPAAEPKLHGPPGNVLAYTVGGKPFAWFKTSEPERWRFSFRATPERFLELTGIPGVKPARFMGRFHWVTIVDVRSFPEDYLRELIAWSHARALSTLSKRKQAEIVGAAPKPAKPQTGGT